ncbi:MAG: hypothetical protein EXR12_05055 [Rhodospirillaceae bacterium]|nr:hypothetical protein [Rhodospirillaceae bacterium]
MPPVLVMVAAPAEPEFWKLRVAPLALVMLALPAVESAKKFSVAPAPDHARHDDHTLQLPGGSREEAGPTANS